MSTATMSSALVCFLTGLLILTVVKYNVMIEPTPIYDIVFLFIMMICMYYINSITMQSRCGASNMSQVAAATFLPWGIMYGLTIGVLYYFQGWKQPFSNTFGYMVAILANGVGALLPLLPSQPIQDLILDNPALLLNQFSLVNFDAIFARLEMQGDEQAVQAFRNVILLKELVAESVWYLLVGLVVMTTSYNIVINYQCTLKDLSPPPEPPPTPSREYSV
jgi:hypothetical protein